ncbi:MAG TPA: alpha/beta fold hydrolase [Deltaproteobacteria bacterium]|nr:alpha/beta fold hydrolase [Deltaproteobacteria bacterium]HPP80303.1 alpha/beta fold hydrolase [Deltaproteobacteria bacterium]
MVSEAVTFISRSEVIRGTLVVPRSSRPCPALILCHGALDFKESFDELAQFLASRGVASLAIDMHGHGASGGPRYHVDIGDWVEDVRQGVTYLESLPRIKKGAVGALGFSSGGTAVLEAAVLDERISCLVTLGATVCTSLGFLDAVAVRALGVIGTLAGLLTGKGLRLDMQSEFAKVPATVDSAFNRRWREDPRVIAMWSDVPFPGIVSAFVVDTLSRVGRIRAPTLVIHGEEDRVDPPTSALKLMAALRCPKELFLVPKSGHMVHRDALRHEVFERVCLWARAHPV